MTPEELELCTNMTYTADAGGDRLDVFAAKMSGETRSCIQRLIQEGHVLLNGKNAKANAKVAAGDTVDLFFPPPAMTDLVAEDIPLSVIYEDSDIAVIDKPKGMVVHPAPGNPSGTLVNAIMYHIKDLSGIGGEMRPGIVHRIDKMTSGLLVIAKNDAAHRSLSAQIKEHSARRTYLALVEGNFREEEGTVDAPIGRHRTDRKRMAVVPDGREAVTHWKVLKRFGEFTLVRADLETGRTHQIRVHLSHIKHPVAGDVVYGPDRPKLGLDGQALHAAKLVLTHPSTGERMEFFAPLPEYFSTALRKLGMGAEEEIQL